MTKVIDKLIKDSMEKYFPYEQWKKEGLQISYTSKFTKEELIGLIPKFQGSDGEKLLANIFMSDFTWSFWENMEKNVPEDEKAEFMKLKETESYKEMFAQMVEYQKFESTETGKKIHCRF